MSVILFIDMQTQKLEAQGTFSAIVFFKDTRREKAHSNKTRALNEKFEYGHLDSWCIKSIFYKKFLN